VSRAGLEAAGLGSRGSGGSDAEGAPGPDVALSELRLARVCRCDRQPAALSAP
jgi:hypothetical protein